VGVKPSTYGSSVLPIYLFSKTANSNVNYVPILSTEFFQPNIDFTKYDAIVLTSKQAVPALDKINSGWKQVPLLTIAEKTAKEAEQAGATVMLSGDGYGDSLAEIIINGFSNKRWLYPRPEIVASNFAQKVRDSGVNMDDVIVYKTYCNTATSTLKLEDNAVLIFTSPFTIQCFLKYYQFKPTQKIVVIGKTTAAALPNGVIYQMPDKPNVDTSVALAQRISEEYFT